MVSAMTSREDIKYVGMSMKSNLNYYDIFSSKYSRRACAELKKMIIRPEQLNISGNMYGPNGRSLESMVDPPSEERRRLRDAARETYKSSHQNIIYQPVPTLFFSLMGINKRLDVSLNDLPKCLPWKITTKKFVPEHYFLC